MNLVLHICILSLISPLPGEHTFFIFDELMISESKHTFRTLSLVCIRKGEVFCVEPTSRRPVSSSAAPNIALPVYRSLTSGHDGGGGGGGPRRNHTVIGNPLCEEMPQVDSSKSELKLSSLT